MTETKLRGGIVPRRPGPANIDPCIWDWDEKDSDKKRPYFPVVITECGIGNVSPFMGGKEGTMCPWCKKPKYYSHVLTMKLKIYQMIKDNRKRKEQ